MSFTRTRNGKQHQVNRVVGYHGMTSTPTYKSWQKMKERCYSAKANRYHVYGGRGIKVCERWLNSFTNFLEDMGERPEGMTLDRVDVNSDYTPKNCRWATYKEQSNNKSSNRLLTFNNETLTVSQWGDRFHIKRATISARINNYGWSIEKAILTPVRRHK